MTDITVKVKDFDGVVHNLIAPEGYRLMEVIRDYELPIKAECGGACACATCHVYVSENWLNKLIPAGEEEIKMLDDAFFVKSNSRLSCQIIVKPEFDGLEIEIAPNSD
jgi:2Fe-2S ferredoxin